MLRKAARPNPGKREVSRGTSIPAPVGGWDAVHALADMPEDRAVVLENWFPSTSDVRVRRGHQIHGSGMGTGVVDSLMVYNGLTAATSKMFAATNSSIYDTSSAAAATISDRTGLANVRWQYCNFTTSGGKFLWACNGADDPIHYNGSVWAEPSIIGVTGSDIINVNGHKNRLWFVFKDSTKAGYLATGAVAGAVTTFELGGLFTQGGYLVAQATWTRDGGAGADDLAVFISSRGQVAVYAGTDPASGSTWELIGVYDVGPPIGYRCFTKVGGDLALLNIDGVLPLSNILNLDRAAQQTAAITANINNAMNDAARSYKANFGWELTPYAKGTMALLNVPIQEGQLQHQYVMNTITGAWCKFTGLNANCWAVFKDNLYFGGNDGFVYQADTTGIDVTTPIDAIGQGAYNYYKMAGRLKNWKLLQPLLTTDSDSRPAIGISTDFRDNASLGTPSSSSTISALYDTAIYDTDMYAIESRTVADWTSISGIGQCASIHFRARTGRESGVSIWGVSDWGESQWSYSVSGDVVMRMNGFNVIHENGGFF
jgi:hypothetical protein